MMTSADPLFRLSGLSKRYGTDIVFNDLSLDLYPGELVLLLGANGAGKSTLLRICAGLSSPDSGSIQWRDRSTGTLQNFKRGQVREISHVGHQLMLYRSLTVSENLQLFSSLLGHVGSIDSILEQWDLGAFSNKQVADLSRGTQFRVSLARAFLGDPSFVFLDEPSSSLDEKALGHLVSALENLQKKSSKPRCVVVATHDVNRLIPFATRLLFLEKGEISRDTSTDSLQGVREEVFVQIVTEYRERNR